MQKHKNLHVNVTLYLPAAEIAEIRREFATEKIKLSNWVAKKIKEELERRKRNNA